MHRFQLTEIAKYCLVTFGAVSSPLCVAAATTYDVGTFEEFRAAVQASGDRDIKLTKDLVADSQGVLIDSGTVVLDGSDQGFSIDLSNWTGGSDKYLHSKAGTLDLRNFGKITLDADGIPGTVTGGILNKSSTDSYNLFIDQDNTSTVLDAVVFQENDSSHPGGAAVHFLGSGTLEVKKSAFVKNRISAANGGGGLSMRNGTYAHISHSLFLDNEAYTDGGAINLDENNAPQLFVDMSNFVGNKATDPTQKGSGGAISAWKVGQSVTIRDSAFTGNSATRHGGAISFISAIKGNQLTLIANQRDTVFSDNTAGIKGNDIYIERASLNLNAAQGRYIEFNGGIAGKSYEVNINKPDVRFAESVQNFTENPLLTAPIGGEVRFNAPIENTSINVYNGTVSLLEAGDVLKTSKLIFHGPATLNVQNRALQTIHIESIQAPNGSVDVMVDVDLQKKLADTFKQTRGSMLYPGHQLLVSSWQVIEDNDKDQTVTVNLSEDPGIKVDGLGLADSGQKAIGSIYLWDVSYVGDGNYEFVRAGTVQPKPDPEPQPDPDPNPQPEPSPDPEINPAPDHYNPQLYENSLAAVGVSIMQHAIADGIFNRYREGLPVDNEQPEHFPWWVKVVGASLDIDPDNFSSLDFDYGVGMMGYDFDPIYTHKGEVYQFGIYGGWAGSQNKFAGSNKLKQNGAFVGGSSFYQNGVWWAGLNVDAGWMDNRNSSPMGKTDSDMPWLGAGLTVGATFNLPAQQVVIQPSVAASYVFIKGDTYETARQVKVKMDDVSSWEISPGVSVTKQFRDGLRVSANARYAWIEDGLKDGIVKESIHLPALSFDDYVEYGLSMQKRATDSVWSMALSRHDIGRTGWAANLYYGWRF